MSFMRNLIDSITPPVKRAIGRKLAPFLPVREMIGAPECPLLERWELIDTPSFGVMIHHFFPNQADVDPHDHPWPFVTFVLAGEYIDLVPCDSPHEPTSGCALCLHSDPELRPHRGLKVNERMRAGMIRRRRASHTHITVSGPKGAWTLLLTGPQRSGMWGFLREGRWWTFKDYVEHFGYGMRCE